MSWHGASAGSSSCRSLACFCQSPRVLGLAWTPLSSRSSFTEFFRPSRDVLTPDLTRLAAVSQCAVSSELVPLRALLPHCGWRSAPVASVSSCHFDFIITTVLTSRVIMRGGLAHVSDVSHRFPPRSAAVAHDVGVVAKISGGYPLRRSSLNVGVPIAEGIFPLLSSPRASPLRAQPYHVVP
jgi:hypothetical protein